MKKNNTWLSIKRVSLGITILMLLYVGNAYSQKVNLIQELKKNFNGQNLEVEISNIEVLNLSGITYNSDSDNKEYFKRNPIKANSENEVTNKLINSPYSKYYGELSFNLKQYSLKIIERETKRVIHIQSGQVENASIAVDADSKYTVSYTLSNKVDFRIMFRYFDKGDSRSPVVLNVISVDTNRGSIIEYYGSSTIEGVILL